MGNFRHHLCQQRFTPDCYGREKHRSRRFGLIGCKQLCGPAPNQVSNPNNGALHTFLHWVNASSFANLPNAAGPRVTRREVLFAALDCNAGIFPSLKTRNLARAPNSSSGLRGSTSSTTQTLMAFALRSRPSVSWASHQHARPAHPAACIEAVFLANGKTELRLSHGPERFGAVLFCEARNGLYAACTNMALGVTATGL